MFKNDEEQALTRKVKTIPYLAFDKFSQPFSELEMFFDVAEPVNEAHRSHNPLQEIDRGHDCNEHEPEPDKQVDLLIKQVD